MLTPAGEPIFTTLQLHAGMVVRDLAEGHGAHQVEGEPERLAHTPSEAVVHFGDDPDHPVVCGVLRRWAQVA